METTRRYLDNTMLKDYKDCPRKYFLRHKKKWRRTGIAAPLVFGLSWHAAMDVLWSNFGKVEDGELLTMAAGAFDQCWIEQGMPVEMSSDYLRGRLWSQGRCLQDILILEDTSCREWLLYHVNSPSPPLYLDLIIVGTVESLTKSLTTTE